MSCGWSFLAEDHTLTYMRETLYSPDLFDRHMVSDWQEDRRGMLDHAKGKVRDILRNGDHREYLSREQIRELDWVAQRAQEELNG
jgi:trimethylamine:corrinoid methyltransferase-like protein